MGISGITPIQKLEKLNNGNSTDSLHYKWGGLLYQK